MSTERRQGRNVGPDDTPDLWPSTGPGKAGRLRRKRDRDLFGKVVKPRDKNAEARRQAAIVEYVRWVAPHIRIWAVPNGGWRTKAEAARFKWTGVLAGVLDLTLALPDGKCAFWETKDRSRVSDDQKAMIGWLSANGHSWAVVRTVDDARRELKRLGIETREALTKEDSKYGHAANPN